MSIDTPLNLGFVGEASPRILGPKERYFAKTTLPWMSIGYETMIPPIYILNFYNAIANDGVMVKPKFVKAIAKDGDILEEIPTEIVNPKICSDTTLTMIRTICGKWFRKDLPSRQEASNSAYLERQELPKSLKVRQAINPEV